MNINAQVQVQLTARGLQVLKEFETTEFADLPPTLDYSRTPEADGSWRFQLYELMAIFGPSLPTYASGSQEHLVFVNNAIVFLGSSQTQRAGYAGVRTADGDVFYGELVAAERLGA